MRGARRCRFVARFPTIGAARGDAAMTIEFLITSFIVVVSPGTGVL
jgi:hypothetical protein